MERDLVEKPMDELQGTALQYSCVTAASRGTEDVYWDVDCALTEPGDVTIVTASTASTDVTYLDIDNDVEEEEDLFGDPYNCLLYTSPSPRDA